MSDQDFPTYSELTQTQGWGAATEKVTKVDLVDEATTDQRYTEGAVLGTGGMGKVLLARDARIGRDVAVKVLHGERRIDDEQRERFLREAQVQGQLEHPAIVPVYDIDRRADGSTFFTMRRVVGTTLAKIIEDLRDGTDPKIHTQRELLQAFATVCLAVDYAHSRGVIHRDLKPANIMLGDFGEVYVLDWGVARVLDVSATDVSASRLSRPGMALGTPLYMAPEQMADPEVGPAADVFSLGAILFEILTLERLRFPRVLTAPIDARISVRLPQLAIAPELEAICVKATQEDPDQRYPSARELQEQIARYLEGDRATVQRRALANEHAKRARAALASGRDDDVPMLELARALALDPTNIEHVSMMSEVLRAPPKSMPEDVQQRLDANAAEMVRAGARHVMFASLSWFAFAPLLVVMGVERWDYVVAILGPVLVTVVLAAIARRQYTISRGIQIAMMVSHTFACMALSRLFGPMILMPTLIGTWAIVMQAHPDMPLRRAGLLAGMFGIIVPALLEAAGVLPASYRFDGEFAIVPQLAAFPETLTLVFLAAASVASTIVPGFFVGRLSGALAESQRREMLQTWRLRRLGDSMLRA